MKKPFQKLFFVLAMFALNTYNENAQKEQVASILAKEIIL